MLRPEEARLDERAQGIVAELLVDDVVAVRAVEVEEHGRDALPRHVRDRDEESRALGVHDPLVELEEIRPAARNLEAPLLELDRAAVELVPLLVRLKL